MSTERRSLEDVRHDLDRIDRELVLLLAARVLLVREAFLVKQQDCMVLRDEAREREIVDRALLHGPALPEAELREVMRAVLRFSRRVADGSSG